MYVHRYMFVSISTLIFLLLIHFYYVRSFVRLARFVCLNVKWHNINLWLYLWFWWHFIAFDSRFFRSSIDLMGKNSFTHNFNWIAWPPIFDKWQIYETEKIIISGKNKQLTLGFQITPKHIHKTFIDLPKATEQNISRRFFFLCLCVSFVCLFGKMEWLKHWISHSMETNWFTIQNVI